MIQTLRLPNYLPPSLNALLRVHWTKRRKMKQECKNMVAAYAVKDGIKKAKGKRYVSMYLTMTGRQQRFDEDNAWKAILDALVDAGLLVDDSSEWCEISELRQYRGAETLTEVVLEDF